MSEWFDDLSKGLAAGQSRRTALGLLGRGVVGAALTSLLPGRALAAGGGNSNCAHFCNDVFPPGPDRGKCKSEGAQGHGLCTTACGPGGSGGTLCGVAGGYSATTCCAGAQVCVTNACCTPKTCADFPGQQGTFANACGGQITCTCQNCTHVVNGSCFPICTIGPGCEPCAGTAYGCICEYSWDGTPVKHACIADACSAAPPCSSSADCSPGNVCVHAFGCGGQLTCQPACPCC